jgi:hypothetical protein
VALARLRINQAPLRRSRVEPAIPPSALALTTSTS